VSTTRAIVVILCGVVLVYLAGWYVAGRRKPDRQTIQIKIAYGNQPGEPVDLAAQEWARLARERSGGRVVLQLFPSNQLGSQKDVTEQAMMGGNVFHITDPSFLMDLVPDMGILAGPFLCDSYDELLYLAETDWWTGLEEELRLRGLRVVAGNWLYGTRHTLATRPARRPEDFRGMKIRCPNADMMVKAIDGMGATPAPMAFSDLYPALAQGVVDGAENPLPVLYGAKLHEQAKYCVLTGHILMISQFVGGERFLSSLPEDVQDLLAETGREAGLFMNELIVEAEAEAVEQLESEGVTFNEVDKAAFKQAARGVYDRFPLWTPGLYDRVQGLLGEYRRGDMELRPEEEERGQ
jgi:tripartite ATP-independent transporter DctP family solute receptor